MNDALSNGAEKLLKDILDHRTEEGLVNTEFFCQKFEAMTPGEDEIYRSCFAELSDHGMIKTCWADDKPYIISLTSFAVEYFSSKKELEKKNRKESHRSQRHDIWVAALGALFGGIVTFVLFRLFGIG